MDPIFAAHIREYEDGSLDVQSVSEHSEKTAHYAESALREAGFASCGRLAGLVHDMGKRTEAFNKYIYDASAGKDVAKGSVNHTFAGVKFLIDTFHSGDKFRRLTSEIVSYAAGAHHGLFDVIAKDSNGFDHRLSFGSRFEKRQYDETIKNCETENINPSALDSLFKESVGEVRTAVEAMADTLEACGQLAPEAMRQEMSFQLGLLCRLILSAVIEGDRRDTFEFMSGIPFPAYPAGEMRRHLWEDTLQKTEQKIKAFPCRTPIDEARRRISDLCRKKASEPGGLFRLNVPTGAGKTLSSLRFALAHAAKYNKSRIIFISPLLSILEQNAAVYREYIGNDDIILEHHSNVVEEDGKEDGPSKRELLTESWEAPIIITTLVQLLDTIFGGKTGQIRRFNALCRSVIVIDEVQSVPAKMLSMFNSAVNFLSERCGATFVLCTATQPPFELADRPMRNAIADIVPHDNALWEVFKRTRMEYAGPIKLNEIPAFALDVLSDSDDLLIICNKKAQAESLCRSIASEYLKIFYLSASLCPEHRRTVLKNIRESLSSDDGKKTVCVSTQVIEAGVDISFSCVIRLMAGMDNAAQASGRCNRNGEHKEPRPVYLLSVSDENLKNLREILNAKKASAEFLAKYGYGPEKFGKDLQGEKAVQGYYEAFYRNIGIENKGYQDYYDPVGDLRLYDILGENQKYCIPACKYDYILRQAFKTAGDIFTVFDEDTHTIIVPYGEGESIISELAAPQAQYDIRHLKELLKIASPYSVSVYDGQMKRLREIGAVYETAGGLCTVMLKEYYDAEYGVTLRSDNKALFM